MDPTKADFDKLTRRITDLEAQVKGIDKAVSQRLATWNKAMEQQMKAEKPSTWQCVGCGGTFPDTQGKLVHFAGGAKTVGPLCGKCLADARANQQGKSNS